MSSAIGFTTHKTGDSYLVREGTKKDINQLVQLDAIGYKNGWTHEDFTSRMKNNDVRIAVLEDPFVSNGMIVGYLCYECVIVSNEDNIGVIPESIQEETIMALHVVSVVVLPNYRRKGIAKGLIEIVSTNLKSRCPLVLTEVPEDNLSAQLFFKNLGFHCFKVWNRSEPALYLMRKLA